MSRSPPVHRGPPDVLGGDRLAGVAHPLAQPTWRDLAVAQDGVLGRAQGLAAGLTPAAWQHALARGWWRLLLPGVALLSSAPPDDRQLAWATTVYAGDGAVLSGRAALALDGLRLARLEDVPVLDVLVDHRRSMRPQPSLAALRRRQRLLADEGPLPAPAVAAPRDACTPAVAPPLLRVVPRRVVDLAPLVGSAVGPRRVRTSVATLHAAAWSPSPAAAETVLAVAVQQRLVAPGRLRAELALLPRLPRRRLLTEVLEDLDLGVQARGELQFVRLLRRAGLPLPDVLQRVVRPGGRRYVLDGWYERQRVAVELDGAHHRDVVTWEADLLRSNDLGLARRDAVLLRFTTALLRHRPARVVAQLRLALR